jgi:hypothetical protein
LLRPSPAPAAPAAELTTDKPSLLEEFDAAAKAAEKPPVQPVAAENKAPEKAADAKPEGDKPADAKPADAKPAEVNLKRKPAEAAKPGEVAKPAVDAPKPEPIKFEFELPPVLAANDEKIGTFNTLLNEAGLNAELGKDVGQDLLNLHAEGMQAYADHSPRNSTACSTTRATAGRSKCWPTSSSAAPATRPRWARSHACATSRWARRTARLRTVSAHHRRRRSSGVPAHDAQPLARARRAAGERDPERSETDPGSTGQGRTAARVIYDHPRSQPGGRQ